MGVTRPGLVTGAAIAVSLPMLPSFLDGAISPTSLLVRFAFAIVVCWAGVAVVERVYGTYSRQARQEEIRRAVERARRQGPPPAADRDDGREG